MFSSTAQGFMPVRGIRPFWNRPPPIPAAPGVPQPWIFVQHPPEHVPAGPPPVPHQPHSPPVQPQQPTAPAPEAEVPQCPVCKALLPPSVNRDEHVNGHFE